MTEEPSTPGAHAHDHGEIHLPPPSYWPPVMAIGLAAALTGLVIRPAVWIVGLLIVAVALSGWLRELGRDILEAPEPEA